MYGCNLKPAPPLTEATESLRSKLFLAILLALLLRMFWACKHISNTHAQELERVQVLAEEVRGFAALPSPL
jgi:hypothetical protein